MKAVASHLDIRWLSEPEAQTLRVRAGQKELARTELPFEEGNGRGWIEVMDLPMGMHLCRVAHRFEPGASGLRSMSEVVDVLTEPVLFVQTAHRGQGVLHDRRLDLRLEYDSRVGLFQHTDRIDHRHWADTSATVEVTALGIRVSNIRKSLGAPAVKVLFEALGIGDLPSASVHPMPKHIRAILQSCFAEHLTGKLRKLHAQAKVLDFLVALSGHFADEAKPAVRRIQLIRQLREELNQLNGTVPCLAELAKRYGLSERMLNDLFKREYGLSIYAYVTDLRLEAAHAVLQRSNTPMKIVAARLGYSSVSHFSNVFTQKFGYRPGRVRRAGSGQTENTDQPVICESEIAGT